MMGNVPRIPRAGIFPGSGTTETADFPSRLVQTDGVRILDEVCEESFAGIIQLGNIIPF